MVKIRFLTRECEEKFGRILEQFPKIDELHPFYRFLFDNHYDKNHYKLSLGQINALKTQITKVGADYTKLIKHGGALYDCKRLKTAAFGRIVTLIRKQNLAFKYLEDVRQHISRLPSIDPSIRTLMLAGCPNAGKSSFMNLVCRAKPEVQPYAFTTKSLYVGHFDYEYIRWQVIDSPGILDRPMDQMNTIELNSVTGLTHIECAVLFFIDLSEMCDITVESQINILECVKPLFDKRPFAIACNKCDLMSLEKLAQEHPEKRALLQKYEDEGVPVFEISTMMKTGVQELKNEMCAKMMSYCVTKKLNSKRVDQILNRIYVAKPPTGTEKGETFVPDRVRALHEGKEFYTKLTDENPDVELEKDIEEKAGLFYTTDYNKNKLLENEEEKTDKVPVFKDGKNIADFVDDNFDEKLKNLLLDEQKKIDDGFYDDDPADEYTEQEEKIVALAEEIDNQIVVDNINARLDTGSGVQTINRASRSRTQDRTASGFRANMESFGVDMQDTASSKFVRSKKRERSESVAAKAGKRDGSRAPSKMMRMESVAAKRARSKSVPRDEIGVPDPEKRKELAIKGKKALKSGQVKGKSTESSRHIFDLKPKHLFSGKRGLGTNQRR